ncbi:ABC transporter ATP-binding protein [Vagococcus acidifermentans]|uniref:Multidrug ABC transporter permease/ATP-binding protein n=1 Tax=Vagococcus acidifermentans TaxID=564710 RepID=A0A430AXU0_9ENTE|nr:ABC transporter transmembrane domain-containing protein [Vagococcus acidifermentans]RSU12873.1 multidrug ABC transporter permease/ATP-binding protein [Vagococcus acidifermentans]
MSVYKKLGWFFKQEKKAYLIGITALLMVSVINLLPPKIIGMIVDDIAGRQLTFQKMIFWGGWLVIAAVAQYLLRFVWRTKIWGSAAKLEKLLRQRLFHHLTTMDQIFFQKYRTGDLMAHATNDLNAIQMVAGAGILTFADSFLTGAITIIAMMVVVDWRLTLIALVPLPFLAVTSRVLGNKLHDAFRESQAAFSTLNDKTQETITGIKVIKTFGQEKEEVEDFQEKVDDSIRKNNRVNFLDALFDPFITLIIGASYVVTIILGGYFVKNNEITIGQLITFINYINMLVWPMFAIGRFFNVLQRGNASYDRVEELLREKSHIVEAVKGIDTPAHGNVDYHVKRFNYYNDDQVTLQNIDFTIEEGRTLGIVGRTGAGKTTILKLLMREYDEYEGEINFGGHSLQTYSLDALLTSIGYVPQDHFLFSMTVRDNIRFAKPDASQEEVEHIARIAAIHDDILGFSNGYDTMVGERGVSLSGGQKQRISIARALLADPELLILDDALSAVDAKTEEKILDNLKTLRQNKTTIINAHRLSSVMHADEILVIDQGQITERGTHDELIASGGWYKKMYDKQQLEAKIEGGNE